MPRRASVSRDDNHWEVRGTFQNLGCSIIDTSLPPEAGFPDFVVGCMGVTHLVEVKNPETAYGRKGLSVSQTQFTQRWSGSTVEVVTSVDDVVELVQKWRRRK